MRTRVSSGIGLPLVWISNKKVEQTVGNQPRQGKDGRSRPKTPATSHGM